MNDAPGIPTIVFRYWAAIGFFLLPISIAHTVFLAPTVAGTATFAPNAAVYVVLAAISWLVVYTLMTIQLFRVTDAESLREFFESLTVGQQGTLLFFVVVFVNAVVVLAGVAGTFVASMTVPAVGVGIAVAYPFFELRFALSVPTPAKTIVGATIKTAHALGTARSVTVERFVESLPGGRKPGNGVTGPA
jgi:hypothetical protein